MPYTYAIMIHAGSFHFPSNERINRYISRNPNVYPWPLFFENGLEWINCHDITIFYGNNGSGKSTVLNLLGEKLGAHRRVPVYKDIVYRDYVDPVNSFDEFVDMIEVRMALDDEGYPRLLPRRILLLTSDDVFKTMEERVKHNELSQQEFAQAKEAHRQIKAEGQGFQLKGMADFDKLSEILSARRITRNKYAEAHSRRKTKIESNGETALSLFTESFEEGGVYLLDEPENCLSPIYQIELMKLILDSSVYLNCQFLICTHSPLILSLPNALIYDLDARPVKEKSWTELENARVYYEFFKKHEGEFKDN